MNGMHIMIREGTGARNLKDLLPVVNPRTARRMMWCTDDRHPHALLEEGHIDSIVRAAIRLGLDPVTAIQMATLNPAEYFGLKEVGAIASGRRADLVVFSDLEAPRMEAVFHRGMLVAQDGAILPEIEKPAPLPVTPSMNVRMDELDFVIPAEGSRVRVIDIVPGQIITGQRIMDAPRSGNTVTADVSRDLAKIAVVERHTGSGNVGKALVRGFGLQRGALASSVAHDSHNIIVVGTNDADMQAAVQCVVEMGGGLAAACDGRIGARLALPVAGLMACEPVRRVRDRLDRLIQVSREFGSALDEPFMALSFLALPVIPALKITDKGLVDVTQFKPVPLFVS
jgi:adenine deaminase